MLLFSSRRNYRRQVLDLQVVRTGMEMEIDLEGTRAIARLDAAAAPATCEALAGLLPFSTTVHYAKIAGDEFYLHVPLVLDVERGRRVPVLPRGAVAFWPERQLFCVYHGRIQDEDATVTFLGQIVGNLEGLAAAGDRLREGSPAGPRVAHLRPVGSEAAPRVAPHDLVQRSTPLAGRVAAAYAAIAERAPGEVRALLAQRGVMRPAGPVLYAEAETRKLHETLWLIRQEARASGVVPSLASTILRHCAGRLRGWYQLGDAAALVDEVAGALPGLPCAQATEVVEALMLYVGRLNLWVDASIPWDGLNRLLARS